MLFHVIYSFFWDFFLQALANLEVWHLPSVYCISSPISVPHSPGGSERANTCADALLQRELEEPAAAAIYNLTA